MSELNAINSSNIAFGSTKVEKKEDDKGVEIAALPVDEKPSIGEKLTQPIRDEFHKAYGDDAKATPSLVADFISDNIIKIGVAVAGGAAILARARKSTGGLTEALKAGVQKVKGDDSLNAIKKVTGTLKGTMDEMKKLNLKKAQDAVEATAKSGEKIGLMTRVKDAILQPKEFQEGTKLAGVVDRVFGKHAKTVKGALGKVGIATGSDMAGTAIALGAAGAASAGANEIGDDVTEGDNDKLALQSRIQSFENAVKAADKLANTVSLLAG